MIQAIGLPQIQGGPLATACLTRTALRLCRGDERGNRLLVASYNYLSRNRKLFDQLGQIALRLFDGHGAHFLATFFR